MWTALILVTGARARGFDSSFSLPDCGTNCLFLLLKLGGASAGLGDIQSALPPPNRQGYSMLELQSAARRCGLNLAGQRFGPGDGPLAAPAIAYRPGYKPASGHFVLLRPVGSHNTVVQIIDPPYPPRVVEYRALFETKGSTIRLLRPKTLAERWAPVLLVVLLVTPFALFLAYRRIHRRAS